MRYALCALMTFAGLALAVGGWCAPAPGAVITLRSAADLPGTRYTLGDIADIESADDGLRRRLAAMPIGLVPRQGYMESVSRMDVETLARQQVAQQAIEWRGASSVRIRGRGQSVDVEQLSDAAAGVLYAQLSKEFKVIDLEPKDIQAINVPAGTLRLTARVPSAQRAGRRMSALVDVSIDGQVYTTVPVWFAVHASHEVLLARSALHQSDALHATDFDTRMLDVADVASGGAPALSGKTPLEGLRLKRPLESGAVLSASHVEQRPAVARNDQVLVRVVNGAVTVESVGIVLADARVGETVKVRNTRTNESYSARVVGEGVVLVRGDR